MENEKRTPRTPKSNQFRKDGELFIVGEHGVKVHLDIEHTGSPWDQYMGLRFRKELPRLGGMTFSFGDNSWFVMVMEDTYIPLDMLFINSSNEVLQIVRNIPALYPGQIIHRQPVKCVLEVNAGLCDTNVIVAGDTVLYNIPGFIQDPGWDIFLNELSTLNSHQS